MEFRTEAVESFLKFISKGQDDPILYRILTLEQRDAKEIDRYYSRLLLERNEKIRKLEEVIIKNELSKVL